MVDLMTKVEKKKAQLAIRRSVASSLQTPTIITPVESVKMAVPTVISAVAQPQPVIIQQSAAPVYAQNTTTYVTSSQPTVSNAAFHSSLTPAIDIVPPVSQAVVAPLYTVDVQPQTTYVAQTVAAQPTITTTYAAQPTITAAYVPQSVQYPQYYSTATTGIVQQPTVVAQQSTTTTTYAPTQTLNTQGSQYQQYSQPASYGSSDDVRSQYIQNQQYYQQIEPNLAQFKQDLTGSQYVSSFTAEHRQRSIDKALAPGGRQVPKSYTGPIIMQDRSYQNQPNRSGYEDSEPMASNPEKVEKKSTQLPNDRLPYGYASTIASANYDIEQARKYQRGEPLSQPPPFQYVPGGASTIANSVYQAPQFGYTQTIPNEKFYGVQTSFNAPYAPGLQGHYNPNDMAVRATPTANDPDPQSKYPTTTHLQYQERVGAYNPPNPSSTPYGHAPLFESEKTNIYLDQNPQWKRNI